MPVDVTHAAHPFSPGTGSSSFYAVTQGGGDTSIQSISWDDYGSQMYTLQNLYKDGKGPNGDPGPSNYGDLYISRYRANAAFSKIEEIDHADHGGGFGVLDPSHSLLASQLTEASKYVVMAYGVTTSPVDSKGRGTMIGLVPFTPSSNSNIGVVAPSSVKTFKPDAYPNPSNSALDINFNTDDPHLTPSVDQRNGFTGLYGSNNGLMQMRYMDQSTGAWSLLLYDLLLVAEHMVLGSAKPQPLKKLTPTPGSFIGATTLAGHTHFGNWAYTLWQNPSVSSFALVHQYDWNNPTVPPVEHVIQPTTPNGTIEPEGLSIGFRTDSNGVKQHTLLIGVNNGPGTYVGNTFDVFEIQ